jgi:hypothetical protein
VNPAAVTVPPAGVGARAPDAVSGLSLDGSAEASGAVLFARFAYPPNELGYCGPNDHVALLQYGSSGSVDRGLAQLARGFGGAWPYLEFIAGRSGIEDPLDRRVVEAYWLGNELLDSIPISAFGASLLERFRRRAGSAWARIEEVVPGGVPNHAFHVLNVYPWVGLLDTGGEHPLHVLDRCRIRWGKVLTVDGDTAVVVSRPLTWDGRRLGLGRYEPETVTRGLGGLALADELAVGDAVALHWGWICTRLSRRQLANLRNNSAQQIELVNRRLAARDLERVLVQ